MILHYIIVDNGDGSASVKFYKTRAEAERADELEMDTYGVTTMSEGACTEDTQSKFFYSTVKEPA